MQTTRRQFTTPRKDRLWTTSAINLDMATGLVSVTDPQITIDFRAKTGREHLKSDTITHLWAKGFVRQSAAGNASPEQISIGIGWFLRTMLAANAPPMANHSGDLVLHDSRLLVEPPAGGDLLIPQENGSWYDLESAGQRSCPGAQEYDLTVIAESLTTPSAGVFELRLAVTALWLIAS